MRVMKLIKKKKEEEKLYFEERSQLYYKLAKLIIREKKERGEDLNTEELENLIDEIRKVVDYDEGSLNYLFFDEIVNFYYYIGVKNPNVAINCLKNLLEDFKRRKEEKHGIFRPIQIYDPNDWKKKIKQK